MTHGQKNIKLHNVILYLFA